MKLKDFKVSEGSFAMETSTCDAEVTAEFNPVAVEVGIPYQSMRSTDLAETIEFLQLIHAKQLKREQRGNH